jgi:SnoaL-like domain
MTSNTVDHYVPAQLFTEIQQFYARQMNLLDGATPDPDAWAGTFTEDAVFGSNMDDAPVIGRAAILESVQGGVARIFAEDVDFRHWFGMLDVEAQEDGSLRTRYYALSMSTPRGGSLDIRGHVVGRDHLVSEDGRWLVRHRHLEADGRKP